MGRTVGLLGSVEGSFEVMREGAKAAACPGGGNMWKAKSLMKTCLSYQGEYNLSGSSHDVRNLGIVTSAESKIRCNTTLYVQSSKPALLRAFSSFSDRGERLSGPQ